MDGDSLGWLMTETSPQAVEELLESLDLEKSSCCMGLSRVSCSHKKATVGLHSLVTLVHVAGPALPAQSYSRNLLVPLLSLAPRAPLSTLGQSFLSSCPP